MDGFLVVAVAHGDDWPVALFATKAEAIAFSDQLEDIPEDCCKLRNMDPNEYICNAIAEFRDGQLVAWETRDCLRVQQEEAILQSAAGR